MKEPVDYTIIPEPVFPKEIWCLIFPYIDKGDFHLYFTINQYILNLLQNLLIDHLKREAELTTLSFHERVRTEYRILTLQKKTFSLTETTINEIVEHASQLEGHYTNYDVDKFLTAIAPSLTSAQSKILVEKILGRFRNDPGSILCTSYHIEKGKKIGLYGTLCELGKNLSEGDCNELAEKYFSTSSITLDMSLIAACGSKIDKNLLKPRLEKIVSNFWHTIHTFQKTIPFTEATMMLFLSDLAFCLDKDKAKELVVDLIQNLSSHQLEIMKYSRNPQQVVSGAQRHLQSLGLLFSQLALRLEPEDLAEVITLLEKGIFTKLFDLTAELHLHLMCSLKEPSSARIIASLIINLLLLPDFPVDPGLETAIDERESSLEFRMRGYLNKVLNSLDEQEIEDLTLLFLKTTKDLNTGDRYLTYSVCLSILLSRLSQPAKTKCHNLAQEISEDIPEKNREHFLDLFIEFSFEENPDFNNPDIMFFDYLSISYPNTTNEEKTNLLINDIATQNRQDNLWLNYLGELQHYHSDLVNTKTIVKLLKILNYPIHRVTDGLKLRQSVLDLVSQMFSQNKIHYTFYPNLFHQGERQTREQLMLANYFKLHLRLTYPAAYIYCLDVDYRHQLKKQLLPFFRASTELSVHAHQEVLTTLKELKDVKEQQDFLDEIDSYSLFNCFGNYKNYELCDNTLKVKEERESCTIS